jgi:hypothetical protein
MHPWAVQELRFANLGDKRLNKRLMRLVGDLAARPEASVPQAAADWAATKAAYRFWDNANVRPSAILQAHVQSTQERLPETGPLLAIQDTTSLDFTPHRSMRGLGYLSRASRRGLLVHSVLCVSGQGVPVGLLHQKVWRRRWQDLGKRSQRRHKETSEKESQRWLTAQTATQKVLPADRDVITVADREADFFDLFTAPRRVRQHFLVRAKRRRCLAEEAGTLLPALQAQPAQGTLTVFLRRGHGQAGRTAKLTVRFGTFAIKPPATHPRRRELAPVSVQALLVQEERPAKGKNPVSWLLLTSWPVTTVAEAAQVVRWYTLRWLIERYHYTLKSGCRIEQLQLETAARLKRALATLAIVAWRLLWLTYAARHHPDVPCDQVLEPDEWQMLQRYFHRPLQQPPTLQEAVGMIARLGGFLGRRHDGSPGVKVLWRGYRRLQDLIKGSQLAIPSCG